MPFPFLPLALTAAGAGLGYLTSGSSKPKQGTMQNPQLMNPQGMQQPTGNAFTGYNAQTQQLPRYTPQVQNVLNQIAPQAFQQIQQNQSNFAPLRQQAMERFQTETVPSIAERFAALNGQGTRGSSGLNSALAGAGAGLERQLAGDEQMFNMQRQQQLMQLLGIGLNPSFENIYMPQTTGIAGGLASGVGQGLGMLGGAYALNQFGNFGGAGATGAATNAAAGAASNPGIWGALSGAAQYAPYAALGYGAYNLGNSLYNRLGG